METAENAKIRRRNVLYDRPSTDDAFSGGGHKRTATALANTIQDFEDQTRSIGLEGKWGSGKSTIIEIAKGVLDGSANGKKYCVFSFDLWTNQNGTFRRAFLESLLSWLETVDKGKTSFVEETRNRIRDRVIDTRSTNVKVFSPFGLIVLAFLIALPWLYMWLSPAAFSMKGASATGMTAVAFGIVALMLVITIFAIAKTYLAAKSRPTAKRLTLAAAASLTLSVFSREAEKVHLTQNIREADPTQNEFEETLREILANFQSKDRRVIIVFDNIDRLPSEKIQEAWSDLRAVLSSSRTDGTGDRALTIIVPYDRNHIVNSIYRSQDLKMALKDDIFRKSFDAIFFVSPPVISDSVHFFTSKFREALGDHFDDESAYRVFKIFDLSREDVAATPRQVVAFINSVATLWEQWGDKVPLPTIATFLVRRDEIETKPEMLRSAESIDPRSRELAGDPELFKHLAALSYNVEPDLAFQVLLHTRIEDVFTSKDMEGARKLSQSPGFDVILPEVYAENADRWAKESITQYRLAAKNLTALDSKQPSLTEAKKSLLKSISKLQNSPPADWEKHHDLAELHAICSPSESAGLIVGVADWLARSLPEREDERTFQHGREWISFIGELCRGSTKAHGKNAADEVLPGIALPSGAEFLVGVAFDADVYEIELTMLGTVSTLASKVGSALESRVVDRPSEFYYAWPQLSHLMEKSIVPGLLAKLATKLSTTDLAGISAGARFLLGNFNMLWEAGEKADPEAAQHRKALISSGSLFKIIHDARDSLEDDDVAARAEALWLLADHCRNKSLLAGDISHPTFGLLNQARDYAREILNKGEVDSGTLDMLVDTSNQRRRFSAWISASAKDRSTTGLLQAIIRRLASSDEYSPPQLEVFIANYEFLKDLLGDGIVGLLSSVGSVYTSEEYSSLMLEKIPALLVSDISNREEAGWTLVLSLVDSSLRAVDAATWKEALAEDGHLLEVLRARVGGSGLTVPPGPLLGPLADRVVGVMAASAKAPTDFDQVIDVLPINSRNGLRTGVMERLATVVVTGEGLLAAISSFPRLLASLPFQQHPDTSVRKLAIPAIQSGVEAARDFLFANQDGFRECMRSVDAGLLGQVQELIGEDLAGDDELLLEVRKNLRRSLGLPPLEKPVVIEAGKDAADSANEAGE